MYPPPLPVPRKDAVSEVMDEEEVQETDYDTEDLTDIATDSESEGVPEDLTGSDPDPEGDPQ